MRLILAVAAIRNSKKAAGNKDAQQADMMTSLQSRMIALTLPIVIASMRATKSYYYCHDYYHQVYY